MRVTERGVVAKFDRLPLRGDTLNGDRLPDLLHQVRANVAQSRDGLTTPLRCRGCTLCRRDGERRPRLSGGASSELERRGNQHHAGYKLERQNLECPASWQIRFANFGS